MPPSAATVASRLAQLEARVRRDFEYLQLTQFGLSGVGNNTNNTNEVSWVSELNSRLPQPLPADVLDVAVVGAGMAGCTAAAAITMTGVTHVELFDGAPEAREGPWVTTARMQTLRSPKQLAGPALGIPSLTFRAWFDATQEEEGWAPPEATTADAARTNGSNGKTQPQPASGNSNKSAGGVTGGPNWEKLDKIPTAMWAEYLSWYRRVLRLRVRHAHRLVDLIPPPAGEKITANSYVTLVFEQRAELEGNPAVLDAKLAAHGNSSNKNKNNQPKDAAAANNAGSGGSPANPLSPTTKAEAVTTVTVKARRVVLATGRAGLGGAHVPPHFIAHLPRHCWTHTAHLYDYTSLKGKRVGVIGGGSSAMDSAGTALENGAASVDLLVRRPDFVRVNKSKGDSRGQPLGTADVPDKWKFAVMSYKNENVPPPHGSVRRVGAFPNAHFRLGTTTKSLTYDEATKEVVVHTVKTATAGGGGNGNNGKTSPTKGKNNSNSNNNKSGGTTGNHQAEAQQEREYRYDVVIFATGYLHVDWEQRPEFARIAPRVAQWRDVFDPRDPSNRLSVQTPASNNTTIARRRSSSNGNGSGKNNNNNTTNNNNNGGSIDDAARISSIDEEMLNWPYLGLHFEFLERGKLKKNGRSGNHDRVDGDEPLSVITCFAHVAGASHGSISGDIPAVSVGARRLAQGLAAALYALMVPQELQRLCDYAEPELDGTEWTNATD